MFYLDRERSCKHHTTHDRYLCNGPVEVTNGVTNVIKPLNVIKKMTSNDFLSIIISDFPN